MNITMRLVPVNGKIKTATAPIRMTTADNVRLWLIGDKCMNHLTRRMLRTTNTKDEAARKLLHTLNDMGLKETPDGAKLTYTSIRNALLWQDGY